MLLILLIGGLAYFLGRRAVDKDRQPYLYWGLTVLVWFTAQFIAGAIIGLVSPQTLDNTFTVGVISIISSLVGYGLLYWYVDRLPHKQTMESKIRELGKDQPD